MYMRQVLFIIICWNTKLFQINWPLTSYEQVWRGRHGSKLEMSSMQKLLQLLNMQTSVREGSHRNPDSPRHVPWLWQLWCESSARPQDSVFGLRTLSYAECIMYKSPDSVYIRIHSEDHYLTPDRGYEGEKGDETFRINDRFRSQIWHTLSKSDRSMLHQARCHAEAGGHLAQGGGHTGVRGADHQPGGQDQELLKSCEWLNAANLCRRAQVCNLRRILYKRVAPFSDQICEKQLPHGSDWSVQSH